jgi:hypothetical protein
MVYGGRIASTQSNLASLDSQAATGAAFGPSGALAYSGLSGSTTLPSATVGGQIAAFPNRPLVKLSLALVFLRLTSLSSNRL